MPHLSQIKPLRTARRLRGGFRNLARKLTQDVAGIRVGALYSQQLATTPDDFIAREMASRCAPRVPDIDAVLDAEERRLGPDEAVAP